MSGLPQIPVMAVNRRTLFGRAAGGLATAALASLGRAESSSTDGTGFSVPGPHFAPRARRVIYLFQSGGPSHIDLFDHKPQLARHHGKELPDSIRKGQRLTEMTHKQSKFPCVSSSLTFKPYGECGRHLSEVLPHIGSIADEICVVKSMHTEAINHDPAITMMNTGTQQLGKPSMGSWLSYGLGSESRELPSYVVLISQGTGRPGGQPLFSRLWSSGFLPSDHQGVRFRRGRDPVLFLADPPGIDRPGRRAMLDGLARLNRLKQRQVGDPEIETRITQYEMAFRMQASVPDLVDVSDETESTLDGYGSAVRTPGTFAANCLLARRLAERGVRFIQLFHRGWDQHGGLPKALRGQGRDTDQPAAALVKDLKRRGMLDDTLVVWGGEFGRTVYAQGKVSPGNYGRDHHGRCYSLWMAGGGIRGGIEYGRTDDFCYNVVENPVHVNDLNATILHCLGLDHTRLTYPFQGLDQRLTGVDEAHVIDALLA